jgi:hypothetical protein
LIILRASEGNVGTLLLIISLDAVSLYVVPFTQRNLFLTASLLLRLSHPSHLKRTLTYYQLPTSQSPIFRLRTSSLSALSLLNLSATTAANSFPFRPNYPISPHLLAHHITPYYITTHRTEFHLFNHLILMFSLFASLCLLCTFRYGDKFGIRWDTVWP